MIHSAVFRRKVIYLGLIALLLIPLYVVGHPAVGDPTVSGSKPGGRLAQLRTEHELSPAQLGEVDPTSESMKLATLGMRGVAATVLWMKANEYKKKENWEGLVAVVNQMSKLQPNFLSVWEFQSHNLSYNISVEQDDYRFRYLWVKKGIDFLIKGTHYNRREPTLFATVAWYTGQKFNRADESKQFRRLFRGDKDFHEIHLRYVDVDTQARGPDGQPDSWLVSRLWYNRAYDLVDNQGRSIRNKAPHIFFKDGPKALMNYAAAIEDDGVLDEKAEIAWAHADEEWQKFGNRAVLTSIGLTIRLNDREFLLAEAERMTKELDAMAPNMRETIKNEKIAKLTPKERELYEKPYPEITDQQALMAKNDAMAKTVVTHREVAGRAPKEMRAKAYQLANGTAQAEVTADWIDRYRGNVNFEYWRTRCQVERLPDTVTARRHIFTANQLKEKVELDAARKEFELAWDLWAKVIEKNPVLIEFLTEDDLFDHVKSYMILLSQLDEKVPEDFKLQKVIDRYSTMTGSAPPPGMMPPGKPPESKSPESKPPESKPESKPATGGTPPTEDKPAGKAADPGAAKPAETTKPAESGAAKPAENSKPGETPKPAEGGTAKPAEAPKPAEN